MVVTRFPSRILLIRLSALLAAKANNAAACGPICAAMQGAFDAMQHCASDDRSTAPAFADEIKTPFPGCDFLRYTAENTRLPRYAAQFMGAAAGHAGRARRAFVTGYEQEMQ